MDIEVLRLMFQENLTQQSLLFAQKLKEQELIRQSLLSQKHDELKKTLFFSQKESESSYDMG
jgi:hypothetical protein